MNMKKKLMSIREVQIAALEILKQIDTICTELGINYYLMYGTLIGAIRHKGFIPWDDDLDIAMKIDDYKIFIDYFNKNNKTQLEIHNFETNKDCFYNISRVCDKTHILKFDYLRYTSGVFVDVYPLEGLGGDDDLPYWKAHFSFFPKWQKHIQLCCTDGLFYGRNVFTRIGNIPNLIISRIIGKQHYINKFNDYKKITINDSKYIGIPSWEYDIYNKEWFDEIVKVPFEDAMVSIPKKYDEVLRHTFGDYMQMPPENQRVSHHGYLSYKK